MKIQYYQSHVRKSWLRKHSRQTADKLKTAEEQSGAAREPDVFLRSCWSNNHNILITY